jgi:xylulokinase
VRDQFGMTWEAFSDVLQITPPGNDGGLMLPWFEPEITPLVRTPGVHCRGLSDEDAARSVRAVVEGQVLAMRMHTAWMGVAFDRIHATGGGAGNQAILQIIANVFGADVHQLAVRNSAALGAALRAAHGELAATGAAADWPDVVRGFVEPVVTIRPDPSLRSIYDKLITDYAWFEQECLRSLD